MTSALLLKVGQVMDMASLLKEGKHAHPGAVDPHDIRVQHVGTDDDMDDPLHKEEIKAYSAAKKAGQAVKDAIRQLAVGRRQITASPQNQQKAIMTVQAARAEHTSALQALEQVSNRRVEQLQRLAETLGLTGGGQQPQQMSMASPAGQKRQGAVGQMQRRAGVATAPAPKPTAPKKSPAPRPNTAVKPQTQPAPPPGGVQPRPAVTGGATPGERDAFEQRVRGAGGGPSAPSAPKPKTAPSAPKPGRSAASTQRQNTRTSIPKTPTLDPGKALREHAGQVAGHYRDVMANTPYDRAMILKHGDHDEGYFDEARKNEPTVDAALLEKHDTPNSPHSEHATSSGGDPDELTMRRQKVRPEEPEPPEELEEENSRGRMGDMRGFRADPHEPLGPHSIEPYAAAQKLALVADTTRVKLMTKKFNNRGMTEGMEDEDAKLDEDDPRFQVDRDQEYGSHGGPNRASDPAGTRGWSRPETWPKQRQQHPIGWGPAHSTGAQEARMPGAEKYDPKPLLRKHEDSEGSTEHHKRSDPHEGGPDMRTQKHIDDEAERMAQYRENIFNYRDHPMQSWWRKQLRDYEDRTSQDPDDGPAMRRAFGEARTRRAPMARGRGMNRALRMARQISAALSYGKTGVDEGYGEQGELDNKSDGRPIPKKPAKGVREDVKNIYQAPVKSDQVSVTLPDGFQRGPLKKAQAAAALVRKAARK